MWMNSVLDEKVWKNSVPDKWRLAWLVLSHEESASDSWHNQIWGPGEVRLQCRYEDSLTLCLRIKDKRPAGLWIALHLHMPFRRLASESLSFRQALGVTCQGISCLMGKRLKLAACVSGGLLHKPESIKRHA